MPISIHLFGGTKGESVVLELPDRSWGVVDCYTSSANELDRNLPATFLKNQDVSDLRFVCLTHPHDDHFSGIMQLLENFNVEQFWHFDGVSPARLRDLIKAKLKEAKKDEESTGRKTNASELARIWKEVHQRSKERKLVIQRLSLGHTCIPSEDGLGFKIEAIGPSPLQTQRFEDLLKHSFDTNGNFLPTVNHRDPNLISCGILIEYGSTRVLLGGDIEDGGWKDLIDQRAFLVERINYVKVAHHGSPNGFVDGLWHLHTNKMEMTYKTLTPFRRYDLPKASTIDHIAGHGSQIFSAGSPYFDPKFVPNYVVSKKALDENKPTSSGMTSRISMTFDDNGSLIGDIELDGDATKIC